MLELSNDDLYLLLQNHTLQHQYNSPSTEASARRSSSIFCFIVQGSKQNIKRKLIKLHRNEKAVCTLDFSFITSNSNIPEVSNHNIFILQGNTYIISYMFLPLSQRKHTFLLSYFQCRSKNISLSLQLTEHQFHIHSH